MRKHADVANAPGVAKDTACCQSDAQSDEEIDLDENMKTVSYLGHHLHRQPDPTDSFVMLPIDTQDHNLIVPEQPVRDNLDQSNALMHQHRVLMEHFPRREESAVVRSFVDCITAGDTRTKCEKWLDDHHWVWDEVEAFFKLPNTAAQVEKGPWTCAPVKQANVSELEPESELLPILDSARGPPSPNAQRTDSTFEPADLVVRQEDDPKDLLQRSPSKVNCQCGRTGTDQASNRAPAIPEVNVPSSPQDYDPTITTRGLQQVISFQSSVNINQPDRTTCPDQSLQNTADSVDHDDYVLPSPLLGSSAAVRFHRPIGLHKRTSTKSNYGLRDVSEAQSHMLSRRERKRPPDNKSTSKTYQQCLENVDPYYAKPRDSSMYDSAHLFRLLESDGPPEEPVTKDLHRHTRKLNGVPQRIELARRPRKSLTLANLDSTTSPNEPSRTNQFQQRLLDPRTFLRKHQHQNEDTGGKVSRKVLKPSNLQSRRGRERLQPFTPSRPARAPRIPELRDIQSTIITNENDAEGFGIMISERVKKRRHQHDRIPPNKKRNTRQISILSSSS